MADAWVVQFRKGLVELCVMAVLQSAESYGYEILQRLAALDGMAVTESTVYPILARLAKEGFVKVRTAPSPSGPPRRYYRLTRLGELRLRDMVGHYRLAHDAVQTLIQRGRT